MHSSSLIAATLLAAASLHADLFLSTHNVLAPDSSEVRRLYGVSTFSNPSSRTNVQVLEKGVLTFVADTIRSEATGTYTANVGLLHPIKRDWSPVRLNRATAISFDVRLDRKPTEGLEISLGSDRVSKEDRDAGHNYGALLTATALPAPMVWATITIDIDDFAPPVWWTPGEGFPSRDSALAAVRFLQFAPKTTYSGTGVDPTLPEIVLELRNIRIVRDDGYPILNPPLLGCEEPARRVLDNFVDGNATNLAGGSWFAFSDTSSLPGKSADSARGTSNVTTTFHPGDVGLGEPGFVSVQAGLHKNVNGTSGWRPYAGWAALSTDFGAGQTLNARGMTGISFQLRLLKAGPAVDGIGFKVALEGVGDDRNHQVLIPGRQIDPQSSQFQSRICVRPEDLHQPSWLTSTVAFSPIGIRSLSWEAKITDEFDSTIANDSVQFTLSDVRIHGDSGSVPAHRAKARASFSASYRAGILTLAPLPGYDQVRIVSSSGRIVASVPAGATQFAQSLERGTWFVIAQSRAGGTISRKLVVLD